MSDEANNQEKPRFPRAEAALVADILVEALRPSCVRIEVAGSLRRRKETVGDVEILFIPKGGQMLHPGEFFERDGDLAAAAIERLLGSGVIERRRNVNGSEMWGAVNKLARHVASGIPVDFFATTEESWWNYLVCRTGPAESNTRIATAAQQRGWKWNPYGVGFSRGGPLSGEAEIYEVRSEEEVFRFVGLPYAEPWERK